MTLCVVFLKAAGEKKGAASLLVRDKWPGHLTLSLLRTQGSGTSPQLHRGVQSARPGGTWEPKPSRGARTVAAGELTKPHSQGPGPGTMAGPG